MPLRFLLDEHLRRRLWTAIQRHNAAGLLPINAVRLGDASDLPLGSDDPDILAWAEREGRILVSRDRRTMPGHLADHLATGNHSPGIFLVRSHCLIAEVVEYLYLATCASEPWEWQ